MFVENLKPYKPFPKGHPRYGEVFAKQSCLLSLVLVLIATIVQASPRLPKRSGSAANEN